MDREQSEQGRERRRRRQGGQRAERGGRGRSASHEIQRSDLTSEPHISSENTTSIRPVSPPSGLLVSSLILLSVALKTKDKREAEAENESDRVRSLN
jgi:hypothetical protein